MLIENRILKAYDGDMKNIVIPEGVRVIAGAVEESDSGKRMQGIKTDGVFYFPFNGCDSIETVTMPDSVEEIGDKAFEHCKNLRSVRFSKNLKRIGLSAFLGCEKLTEITLPASIKTLEQWSFALIDIDSFNYEGTLEQWDEVDINEETFNAYPCINCSDGQIVV